MGMFSNLLSKVFGHHTETAATSTTAPPTATTATPVATPTTPTSTPVAATSPSPAAPAVAKTEVDVTAVLDGLAAKNAEDLNWKKSIVDLLKLVDMDSSLTARKELAQELHYTGDPSDSAELNVWLHKEVIKQIAANGGKVPANLLD